VKGGGQGTIADGRCSDIGWGYSADEVLQALEKVWDIPLSEGAKVLALTVPEIRFKDDDLDKRRNDINEAIKSYKEHNL
jgi:ribosome-binding factor A